MILYAMNHKFMKKEGFDVGDDPNRELYVIFLCDIYNLLQIKFL